jgi:hypothetical protein
MHNAPERIIVAFDGEGSGTEELSWGQQENWSAITRLRSWLPLGGVRPLAPGTTEADIAEELRYAMNRFQSMRTRVSIAPDGRPTQVVAASGEIAVEIHEAGAVAPEKAADALCEQLRESRLDFEREWPIRMAVIRHQQEFTHMVVLMSHFVTDAAGAVVMIEEVGAREPSPVNGLQPMEQARWQQSPAGRRQNEAALRYWEGILRSISPQRFLPPIGKASPRYRRGEFTSAKLGLASRSLVSQTGADAAAVLLTVYAMALAQVAKMDPVVVRPLVSNRFRPGLSAVVCTAAQAGLSVMDVAGLSFAEALPRVQKTVLSAYKYAYFNPGDVAALIERVSAERGTEIDVACFFNDRRVPGPVTEMEPARSTFTWIMERDSPSLEQLIVDAEEVQGAIRLTIHMDGHAISPADGEALMWAMESIAVAALAQ